MLLSQNLWKNVYPEYQLKIPLPPLFVVRWVCLRAAQEANEDKERGKLAFSRETKPSFPKKKTYTFRMSVLCFLLFSHACVTIWKVYSGSPATLAWSIGAQTFTTALYSKAWFIDDSGKEGKREGREERSAVFPLSAHLASQTPLVHFGARGQHFYPSWPVSAFISDFWATSSGWSF